MTRRASASSVSGPLTRSRSERNSSSEYESVSSWLGAGVHAPEVARVAAVAAAEVAGRALDDDDAGAGFARGQRGAQPRVAAAEHRDVVDVLLRRQPAWHAIANL